MTIQNFKLYNPETDESVPLDDDFNLMTFEDMKKRFECLMFNLSWPGNGRYVAVGSYGDCVVYKNGEIDLIADSG